jgi:hypothetical protein
MGRKRIRTGASALLVALVTAGCGTGAAPADAGAPAAVRAPATAGAATSSVEERVVVVHKTASCSCCGSYEDYLAAHGYVVETVLYEDIRDAKEAFGVPAEESSCHTNEIAGYFFEGHVPVEAIETLLDERPEVDGITLAGMPAGSPGMPGEQAEPFVVRTVVDGEVTGELARF